MSETSESGIGRARRAVAAAALLLTFVASSSHAVVLEEGDLLVTDFASGVLVRVNPETFVQTVVASGFAPGSIVVTPERQIFVDDSGNRVVDVDADSGARTDISDVVTFEAPRYLALDTTGQIYVTDATLGAVLRLDPATHFAEVVSSGGLLQQPLGIVREAGGDLLVADPQALAVIRIDPTNGAQSLVTQVGSTIAPRDLAFEASGDLVVVDEAAGALFRVELGTGAETLISSGNLLTKPWAVTVEPDGGLLVCNPRAVLRVDPVSGAQSTLVVAPGIAGGSFVDIEFEGPGSAVVSDQRIALWRLDTTNGDLTQFYQFPPFGSARVWGIALDPAGDIFVAEDLSGQVHRVNEGAQSIVEVSQPQLGNLNSLVLDDDGTLLVVSTRRIVRIDPETGLRTTLVKHPSINFDDGISITRANGIALDGQNRLYIIDFDIEDSDVVRLDLATGMIDFSSYMVERFPVGIAVAPNGDIFVSTCCDIHPTIPQPGRIIRIDPVTAVQTLIASGPPLVDPVRMAVESDGRVVVADGPGGAVLRVDPADGSVSVLTSGGNLPSPTGVAVVHAAAGVPSLAPYALGALTVLIAVAAMCGRHRSGAAVVQKTSLNGSDPPMRRSA